MEMVVFSLSKKLASGFIAEGEFVMLPLGFSPDGKYLLYSWNGHLTPVGAVLECLLQENADSVYIMDLESCNSNYYIAGQKVQWIR